MQSLFAKINPPAQIPVVSSPFAYSALTADYLTAIANPYFLGANQVNFGLVYGSATFDLSGNMETFKTLLTGTVTLSGNEIQSWGLDDSVVLNTICQKLGTTATEFITANPKGFNP